MSHVGEVLERLRADAASGVLGQLCAFHGVDLLILFGSSRTRPPTAADVDLAYAFRHGHPGDDLAVINALGERFGDDLDLMPLDRAGVVAKYAALGLCDVLVELTPGRFANLQMAAFGEYCDTQRFRDAQLEAMAR